LNVLRVDKTKEAQLFTYYQGLLKANHSLQKKFAENSDILKKGIKQEIRQFYAENQGVNSLIQIFMGMMEISDGVNWDLGQGKILQDMSNLHLPCRKVNN